MLSIDQKQTVLENQKLVHHLVQNLGIFPNNSDYEDIVSIGTIGLIKAVINFDISKNTTFSTYASKCIQNEIFIYFRKLKKYANNISIYATIGTDMHGNQITLSDVIEHPDSNFEDKIINNELLIQLSSLVLNYLKGKSRIVILYRMGNITQVDISKMLNISRSYVSCIHSNATSKIMEAINKQVYYKEIFSINITEELYEFSFSPKDIHNFNKIFSNFLQKITSIKSFKDFNVIYDKELILIQLPALPDSFCFIAKFIQEIDNFST